MEGVVALSLSYALLELLNDITIGLRPVGPMNTDDERIMCGVICNVHQTVSREKTTFQQWQESPYLPSLSLTVFYSPWECGIGQVKQLKMHPDIGNLVSTKDLLIVGAYYSFNGVVSFFGEGAQNEPSKVRHIVWKGMSI